MTIKNVKTTTKILTATAAMLLMTACSGTKSTAVAELNKYDKQMSCPELQMDITEATFLRDKAERNKGLSFKNIAMPLSYPSTLMSANDAIEATNNRIEYLNRLYEIKGCAGQGQYAANDMGMAAQPMMAAPAGAYQEMRYAQPMAVQQPQGYGQAQQYARPSYGY